MGCRVRYKIWGGRARGRGVCGCRISGGYGLKEAMCIYILCMDGVTWNMYRLRS